MNRIKQNILPEAEHRLTQLKIEGDLDRQLLNLPCPKTVNCYFYAVREWNRQAYQAGYSDIFNYRARIRQHLECVDKHQHEMTTIFKQADSSQCQQLAQIITKMESKSALKYT